MSSDSTPIDPALLLDPRDLQRQLQEAQNKLEQADDKVAELEATVKQRDTRFTAQEQTIAKHITNAQNFQHFKHRAEEKYARAVRICEALTAANNTAKTQLQQLETKVIQKDQQIAAQLLQLQEWESTSGIRGLAAEHSQLRIPMQEHNEADYGDPRLALKYPGEIDMKKDEIEAENRRFAEIMTKRKGGKCACVMCREDEEEE